MTNNLDDNCTAFSAYLACSPRTFLFKDCTICFCTDVPNSALCWDYKNFQHIQELVNEQLELKNNDSQGVW